MLKLNIGCGLDYREGFVNIDGSSGLPRVDKIIDFNKDRLVDFYDHDSVDYILAKDFIEHFYHWEAIKILSDAYLVLKEGGRIELKAPDLKVICRSLKYSIEEKIHFIYGGQDIQSKETKDAYRTQNPEYFCHKFGYTRKSMKNELEKLGFKVITSKNRGKNFFMIARK